jgi:hypothetical protein
MTWDQIGWFLAPSLFPGPYPKGNTIPLVLF